MTAREKLIATLQIAGAMCDDCLSSSTAIKPRQTVNQRCREMENLGQLTRQRDFCTHCRVSKIVNRLKGGSKTDPRLISTTQERKVEPIPSGEPDKPWYWEGNVQDRIVGHLQKEGWEILSRANTATRESGIDIVATKNGEEMWVSVKGWPEKSVNVQARHWFSGAVFDLVIYKDRNPDVRLAIGLPAGFSTYQNLIPRISWLRKNLPFEVIMASEHGEVEVIK